MFFVPNPLFPAEQARSQSYCLIRDQKTLHRNAHGCAYMYNSIDSFYQRPLGHNNSSPTNSPPLSKTANLENLSGTFKRSFRVSFKYDCGHGEPPDPMRGMQHSPVHCLPGHGCRLCRLGLSGTTYCGANDHHGHCLSFGYVPISFKGNRPRPYRYRVHGTGCRAALGAV